MLQFFMGFRKIKITKNLIFLLSQKKKLVMQLRETK